MIMRTQCRLLQQSRPQAASRHGDGSGERAAALTVGRRRCGLTGAGRAATARTTARWAPAVRQQRERGEEGRRSTWLGPGRDPTPDRHTSSSASSIAAPSWSYARSSSREVTLASAVPSAASIVLLLLVLEVLRLQIIAQKRDRRHGGASAEMLYASMSVKQNRGPCKRIGSCRGHCRGARKQPPLLFARPLCPSLAGHFPLRHRPAMTPH